MVDPDQAVVTFMLDSRVLLSKLRDDDVGLDLGQEMLAYLRHTQASFADALSELARAYRPVNAAAADLFTAAAEAAQQSERLLGDAVTATANTSSTAGRMGAGPDDTAPGAPI